MTRPVTVASLRALPPKSRARAFARLTEAEQEAVTEPCSGAAHENPYIDHCMVCLYTTWGRMLRAPVQS